MAGAVIAGLLVAGCGSSGGGSGANGPDATGPSVPTDVASVVLGPFDAAEGTPEQAATLLAAGCAALAPADRQGDSATLNDYFTDLFDGGSTGDGVQRDRHDVDRALEDGCREHGDDVEEFLAAVADTLALTPMDVQQAIDSACAGYEQRLRANAMDPHAPPALDARVMVVLAAIGLDRPQTLDMIEAYCGPT